MQNIVLAYDGSESSKRALERTAELADDARVTVVSCVSLLTVAGRGSKDVDREEVAFRRQALADARAYLEERGIHPQTVELHAASISRALVEQAAEDGADLIVVGSGGKHLAERMLLGSVSSEVVHRATCDVLVVR